MKEIIIFEPKTGRKAESKRLVEEVKELLNKNGAIYQIYEVNQELNQEEKYKRDWELASQDKKREKEIEWWDKVSDEDDWEQLKNEPEWNFS